MRGEVRKQALVDAARPELAAPALEIAVEESAGDRAEWRDRREAVDRRRVDEHAAHDVAVALAVAVGELARDALGVGLAVPRAQEAALDFTARAARGIAVEARAAE